MVLGGPHRTDREAPPPPAGPQDPVDGNRSSHCRALGPHGRMGALADLDLGREHTHWAAGPANLGHALTE